MMRGFCCKEAIGPVFWSVLQMGCSILEPTTVSVPDFVGSFEYATKLWGGHGKSAPVASNISTFSWMEGFPPLDHASCNEDSAHIAL
eukprot:5838666-Ditylum_brightwellii.AAC.1